MYYFTLRINNIKCEILMPVSCFSVARAKVEMGVTMTRKNMEKYELSETFLTTHFNTKEGTVFSAFEESA